jgi:putative ATP-binding cassette transporter
MKKVLSLVLPMIGRLGFFMYILLGILSGLFSFLFINFLTRVVGLIIAGAYTRPGEEYIILFSLIILFYIWGRKTLSLAIIELSQRLLWSLRMQILSLVLNANYQQLSARKINVRSSMFNDVYVLIDASMNIIGFCTNLILAIACLIYLLSISLLLFSITLGIAILGAAVYHFSSKKAANGFQEYRNLENKFMESFVDIIDGFKEIFMEPRIGRNIFKNKISVIAEDSYNNNLKAFTGFVSNQVIGQVLSYILISSVLLYFSVALKIKAADIVSFVFTLLYLLGAIEAVMVLLPGLMRARIAAANLIDLKKELENAGFSNPLPEKYILKDEFRTLSVRGLKFLYGEGDNSFGIGPINFDVKKGETVFIYGGNGSGKTTFIQSLLGIHTPTEGEISFNTDPLTRENYAVYRTLFSVVFSDFYMFSELYAADTFDSEKWKFYLHLFELEEKVTIEGKRFSTTDLSTGQRKRLALVTALLEEKPILVLDEWAADQDPHFRKKFYTQIIPILKEQEISIIAITHDDKYYSCADRLYKMEYGELTEQDIYIQQAQLIS